MFMTMYPRQVVVRKNVMIQDIQVNARIAVNSRHELSLWHQSRFPHFVVAMIAPTIHKAKRDKSPISSWPKVDRSLSSWCL